MIGANSWIVDASVKNNRPLGAPHSVRPEPVEAVDAVDAVEDAPATPQPAGDDLLAQFREVEVPLPVETATGTTLLPAAAVDAAASEIEAIGPTLHGRDRRSERLVMALSTLLGTLGLAVAAASAGLDQVRYNLPLPCTTYATAHKGAAAFGCSATAKHLAVFVPALGIPLLVLVMLILVWVPRRTSKGRLAWLGGYLVLLAAAAGAVAIAYSNLPQNQ